MKPLPPHLPKQEKKVVSETQKHTLFYFFSCAFIAIAASLSTVFVALTWILPRAVPDVQFYSFQHEPSKPESTVTADIASRISEREALLYDKKNQLGAGWYVVGSALTQGVFLTSDGWVVFPLAEEKIEALKKDLASLEVVDGRGVPYPVTKVIFDKNFHLLYAQVKGSGFRFVSFPNWNTIKSDMPVIGKKYDQFERDILLGMKKTPAPEGSEIWRPQYRFAVEKTDPGMVFTDQGEMLGVVENESVLPGWYIERALVSILSKQTLTYNTFPWKGQFVDHVLEKGFVKPLGGFFITDINGDKTKDTLKVGDVITKIQNEAVNSINVPNLLFQSPDMVSFEILRDGVLIQKTLPKQILNF